MQHRKFVLFTLLLFTALGLSAQYKTGPNGVKYFFWRTYNNPQHAVPGDLVFVHMIAKSEKDSTFLSSYVQGQPFQLFVPKPTYKGCFFEILTMMGEKDSAEVLVNADSLFLNTFGTTVPDFIRPGSNVKILVNMVSIITKFEYEQRMAEEAKHADENQQADIQAYIAKNNLQMSKTTSGLYYQFMLKGKSRHAMKGETVSVHYTGYLLNGKIFDSSRDRNQPFEFTVGQGAVIKGWDEALQLMDVGDKLKVIIPYQLGYGENGAGSNIPPYSPLIFEIELLNIK